MESQEQSFDRELFYNPPAKYRSAPFWAWDGDLKKEELERQIEVFKQMGFGGFYMHARAGLITPYLSDEFMQCVRDCCRKAQEEGMYAWLYDEDRYPSGPAGGIVTRNPEYTRRYIRFTPFAYGEDTDETIPSRGFARSGIWELLARYEVSLDEKGDLAAYRRLDEAEEGREVWFAYFEKQPATQGENQTYVDTLNPDAIRKFAEVTYDRYKETVGEYFGNVSPGIFTDEPQYASMSSLSFAAERQDVILPWTNGFGEAFERLYGFDLLDRLPEVVWNLPEGLSRSRYLYHDFLAECFASAYCDTLGRWCEKNGIWFTGHIMGEGTLKGQSAIAGEIMRCYRAFQLPGIDVLGTHKLEFTTAKQAQSAVRQQGAPAMLSELYGASGWDFDFRGYKLQGDWQAAMGVTLRVPHHSLYTFNGESKRDYPASISYQSGWWKKYSRIEDHFARLNTALTRGTPVVRIGVIHPVESVWLNMGPNDRSSAVIARYERNFQELIDALVYHFLDFDFICESRLSELCPAGGAPLRVGCMAYDAVIVPGLETLRSTTVQRLEAFQAAGGRLIFMGECPRYVDAAADSGILKALYSRSETMDFDVNVLTDTLADFCPLRISLPDGSAAHHIIHQMREDGDSQWLFLATTRRQPSPDADIPNQAIKFNVGQKYETEILRFEVEGEYALEEYDTLSGQIRKLPARYQNGRTVFRRRWHMHDSLLLKLTPGKYEGESAVPEEYTGGRRIFRKVPVTLNEPNVYLLDMAEYALDDEAFRPLEELLKLENICRTECGLPIRKRAIPQPYQMRKEPAGHRIRLRFSVESRVRVENPVLAMESMDESRVWLNGKEMERKAAGWFIDPVIQKMFLPPLEEGINILEAEFPLGLNTKLEYLYLLGDFGVEVAGCSKTITEPVRELAFGSWTSQGLAFYSGSVTYHIDMECAGPAVLRVPHYRGALIEAAVDNEAAGEIIYSPYALEMPGLRAGKHRFNLTLYATRQNTLAALHHLSSIPFAQGPDSWRSTEDLWNYEYSFTPQGILSSPRFYELTGNEGVQ